MTAPRCPEHGIPDCSPLLNGCGRLTAESLCNRKCAPGRADRDCPVHGHMWEPPGPYVVTDLSLDVTADDVETARAAGLPHPESTPVGPFATRANADRWASRYVGSWGSGSGSWAIAPVHPPRERP